MEDHSIRVSVSSAGWLPSISPATVCSCCCQASCASTQPYMSNGHQWKVRMSLWSWALSPFLEGLIECSFSWPNSLCLSSAAEKQNFNSVKNTRHEGWSWSAVSQLQSAILIFLLLFFNPQSLRYDSYHFYSNEEMDEVLLVYTNFGYDIIHDVFSSCSLCTLRIVCLETFPHYSCSPSDRYLPPNG